MARRSVGGIYFMLYVVVPILANVTLATKYSFEWGSCDVFGNIPTSPVVAATTANLCYGNRHLPKTKCMGSATPTCLTELFYDFKICWFYVYTDVKLGRWHREGVRGQIGEEQQRAGENRFMSWNLHPIFLVSCLLQIGETYATKGIKKFYKILWGNWRNNSKWEPYA
jgi:hypothetical protein